MTIITVAITNTNPTAWKWELPPSPDLLRSPVPRGVVKFHGDDAIATKIAGDETFYKLTLTMPTGFVYLPRYFVQRFDSDDLVAEWQLNAMGFYSLASKGSVAAGGAGAIHFNMTSPGALTLGAAAKNFMWTPPVGTPKLIMAGGDQINFYLADMDAGETTAGDMAYQHEFYVFDVDQIDKWELNTPIPVISQGAF